MNNKKKINLEEFETIINNYKDVKGPLIPILHEAENLYGYIPLEIQNLISKKLKISNAEINGVASFYANFHTEPTGTHHVGVCTGTSCHLNGSSKLLQHLERSLDVKEGEITGDGQFSIVPVKCIGNCDKASNITINGEVHNEVSIEELDKIIEKHKKNDN